MLKNYFPPKNDVFSWNRHLNLVSTWNGSQILLEKYVLPKLCDEKVTKLCGKKKMKIKKTNPLFFSTFFYIFFWGRRNKKKFYIDSKNYTIKFENHFVHFSWSTNLYKFCKKKVYQIFGNVSHWSFKIGQKQLLPLTTPKNTSLFEKSEYGLKPSLKTSQNTTPKDHTSVL
jgi:hypothetical protein